MGTASLICAEFEDGSGIATAYCHYDGYPEYNGRLLLNKFNDLESAFEIANLGYLSMLSKDMEDNYDESKHANKADTVFYENMSEVFDAAGPNYGAEFVYYFSNDYWYVWDRYADTVTPLVDMNFKNTLKEDYFN